ncbi:hypothetical protein [Streptococcus sanguinis]|uniref:hypothetical protein n=1 Tax=Streptococcus sanguinis TaxID=1305 RepID=UPI001CBA81CD|nr:hypothetical protein [Streptococcus sanguinis]MBZ2021416.1 hypothetical protein [Streptococcus sanguinis]MBZ2073739.1 hypothetical protein [Streptococcus sanguinis]MBZ2081662.1 hypothetical protein [Streptococcus sanguinis]MCC3165740.1 putative membrane protein [Streptococcus sanguinis]
MLKFLKRLAVIGLFLLALVPAAVSANTPPRPGANGYTNENPNKNIVPKQNNGYAPPNVQEAQKREAERKKEAQDQKEASEKKIDKDRNYQSIEQKAENVDQTLEKEDASTKELEQAEKDMEEIKQYIADHPEEETAAQIQGLKTTQNNFEEKIASKKEDAKAAEEAQTYLKQARDSENPGDMSKLTSYIYVEGGFFNAEDIWPKAVNAISQGIFFLTKALYCLTIIVLEQVFSANTYQELDKVVNFSANFFNTFMTEFRWLIYGVSLMWGVVEFFKTRKFPIRAFRFILVWFFALFLYQQNGLQLNYGNARVPATYNLSKIVKAVDGMGQDITRMAIQGFDQLDDSEASKSIQGQSGDNLTKVKEAIFDQLVYRPFLAMNFKADKLKDQEITNVPEDKVIDLFETKGEQAKVEKLAQKNTDIEQLSFNAMGVKFFTALASLVKAVVVGFALIVIGLISFVFRYLAIFLLVFLVLLLFVAMIPSCEQVLGNAGKKLFQFVLLGSLGLFFIRAFLFVNSLIEGVSGGMTKVYFWVAIIQGLVWVILFKLRHLLGNLFVRGTLSAKELAQKAQSGFDRFSMPRVPGMNRLSPARMLQRSGAVKMAATAFSAARLAMAANSARTLFKAGKNGATGLYDRLRYGAGPSLDKEAAHQSRAEFKQKLQDSKDNLSHLFTMPKAERLRSKIHDLAGDTDTPVQQSYQERESRRLERLERKNQRLKQEADFEQFREEKQRNNPPSSKNPLKNRLAVRGLKREYQKEQLKKRTLEENPAEDLFRKGKK